MILQIQLEDIYQRKAQYALDMAFGSGNFIVNVDFATVRQGDLSRTGEIDLFGT